MSAVDRRAVWPDFREAWIVHRDEHIVVVDKPVGVPSQAAEPDRPDDVVARLSAHLGGVYLGIHQRLDRDTSGLLVFALRREANASLAAQFEGRTVGKTYLACVSGWPRGTGRVTLRGALAPGDGGRMRVVKGRAPGAKNAVTHAKVLARRGDRAMLELQLETGRTHQARAQLAHAGSPIAGDVLYGGAAAPRLMLHASAIALQHPVTGARERFVSATPVELDVWLARGDMGDAVYDDAAALRRALERAVERRWGLGRSEGSARATTAFRLVNEDGDGLPRLAVDVYDAWLVAHLTGEDGPWADSAHRDRVLDALGALGFDGVYLKVRPKQASVITEERREQLAPPRPVRGVAAPSDVAIVEEGVPLRVRLGDGLSTGLFLDQRGNRARVRGMAAGAAVANLFAYTCAFTVVAALGGARRTVSVDASAAALERGRENMAIAGVLDPEKHAFVAGDAFVWLARAGRRGERYDIVILDPPSYSSTKRGRFVAESDYAGLAASAMALLPPGGRLLACTNHRGISRARFRRILFDSARIAKREATQVKDLAEGGDYPTGRGGEGNTKSVLVTMGG